MLPMYEPGAGHTVGAERIVDAFRRCDAVIVSSPAHHGSVSRLLCPGVAVESTNLLRRTGRRLHLLCKRMAGGWTGICRPARDRPRASRLAQPLAVTLYTSTKLFDKKGDCTDSTVMSQLETVGRRVVEFTNWRRFAPTRPAPLHNRGVENTSDQCAART
jgi:FMN reductase